ncbi:MAG: Gfo/Idh/MocA family oxidoreductase [Candidatus Hydrogenedentota bacterium]
MKTLGVGIVGTGWVSGEHIRAFEADPRTKVVALCGRTKDRARAKATVCGLDCDIYDDLALMLDRDDIDIVSIATPPHVHREQAVAAANAGKHLLLEKAMANTIEDVRAIRDAVAAAGVKSVVSFVLRWNPLFEIIKTQLAQGSIGRVFYGEVDYFHGIGPWYGQFHWNVKKEIGGSSLLSAGCHALDSLRWFMGGDVAEVHQYTTRGNGPDFAAYEYEPTSVTILKFADGRIGKVASCIECIQPYVFHINLVGTEGTIRNNKIHSRRQFPGQTNWVEVPTILPDSGDVTHHPFQEEVKHLLTCIETSVESHVNVADAYKTHEIVLAADRSGREGKPIRLPLG